MELDRCFTSKEVKRLFLKRRRRLFTLFFLSFSLIAVYRLLTPPLYTVQSVFKQAASESGESELVRSFLQHSGLSLRETGVISILESRTLLKKVIETLGLAVEEKAPLLPWKTFWDKCRVEAGLCLEETSGPLFSHVRFEGRKPLELKIQPLSQEEFIVYERKNRVAQGRINEPLVLEGAVFTVERALPCTVRLLPWEEVIKKVSKRLKIKASKKEKNVLLLSFAYEKKEKAAAFLNTLMTSYQEYLKEENEELCHVQMAYLQQRQEELLQRYATSLDTHAAFLAKSLEETGFFSSAQEIALLEKPSEEYQEKLYDVDLKLQKLSLREKPSLSHLVQTRQLQEENLEKELQRTGFFTYNVRESRGGLEATTQEAAERILLTYEEERGALQVSIRELMSVQEKLEDPSFDITALAGALTDPVSQQVIREAASVSLGLQDVENRSEKECERIRLSLEGKRRFLSDHLAQMLSMYKVKVDLLKEKEEALRKTSLHLLATEKGLIQQQISSLQEKMKSLPQKWRKEHELMMQRDLSLGVVEGLTQLAESKNIHHKLFQVESKPIDEAFVPHKATKEYVLAIATLVALAFCLVDFLVYLSRFLARGQAINETSAKRLSVTFCGFLQKIIDKGKNRQDREAIRRTAQFISSQGKGCVQTILSEDKKVAYEVAHCLAKQGSSVLVMDCTASLINEKNVTGLYGYLQTKTPLQVLSQEGWDRVEAGPYTEESTELLSKESFSALVREKRQLYDVLLLSMQADLDDPIFEPVRRVSDGFILHKEEVFHEEVDSLRPLAVLLYPV